MRTRLLVAILGVAQFGAVLNMRAQAPATWRDPTEHSVQFVLVEDGVRLEVLDWGGHGRPMVLLAGYLTAHAYDDFAPRLTPFFHVYGITRRGYGASSSPESGYDARRSADDVLRVLDALNLEQPILMGHGFGGQDLSTLGAAYSDRLGGLVYLNSAEDPTVSDYGVQPPDPRQLPAPTRTDPPPDYSSFAAYRSWQRQTLGVAFPESELRQLYAANPDGSVGRYQPDQRVRDAVFAGRAKPDYAAINVPVLAFFRPRPTLQEAARQREPTTEDERAAVAQLHAFRLAIHLRHIGDLRRGVPTARVVELPRANYYNFLSNVPDIMREVRAFAESLPR